MPAARSAGPARGGRARRAARRSRAAAPGRGLRPDRGGGRTATYRPSRAVGAAYAAVLVAVPTLAAARAARGTALRRALATAACGWAALGGRSLRQTALRMADLVDAGDLPAARTLARSLVARRTDALDGPELTRAALESLAENTADAEAGTLFWGAVAGAPGAVAHRAANTLDAMVGYRNARYAEFGWGAARLDDALGNGPRRASRRRDGGRRAAGRGGVRGRAGPPQRPPGGRGRAAGLAPRRRPPPLARTPGAPKPPSLGALGVPWAAPTAYAAGVESRPHLGYGPPPDTAACAAPRGCGGVRRLAHCGRRSPSPRWRPGDPRPRPRPASLG